MNERVDVVVTWVDDGDASWRALRDEHLVADTEGGDDAGRADRYRDWDLLQPWFRGIARNCPWVGTIHLVTESPAPAWLNESHPQVRVVRHGEFIPAEYLPTFNSRAIELNLHRIPGLSERFVYFNDDMFVLRPLPETHFFHGDLPVGFGIMNAISLGDNVSHAMLNNLDVLNARYAKRRVLRASPWRWFTLRYGARLLQNVALIPWPRFTGFLNHHLPLPLRRATMAHVWSTWHDDLDRTCRSRFRRLSDLNVFLFAWWELCENAFAAGRLDRYGRFIQLSDESLDQACAVVQTASTPVVCLNDGPLDFPRAKAALAAAFASRYPDPCRFER